MSDKDDGDGIIGVKWYGSRYLWRQAQSVIKRTMQREEKMV